MNRRHRQLHDHGAVPLLAVESKGHSAGPPRWEGLYSFERAWKASRECILGPPIGLPTEKGQAPLFPGTHTAALLAVGMLDEAHPIFIGRSQLEALPEDEFVQPDDARLPFDTVYFDFASAVGPAWLGGQNRYGIHGAAVQRHPDEPGGLLTNGLTIIPFGAVRDDKGEEIGYDRGDGRPLPPAAPFGLVSFGDCPFKRSQLQVGTVRLETGRELRTLSAVIRAGDIPLFENERQLDPMPGYVVTGPAAAISQYVERDDMAEFGGELGALDPADERHSPIFFIAAICVVQAIAVLRTLYLLESANVTIDEAKVSRPVRRQAERKGYGIASTVYVRPTHVRREARLPGSAGAREFSHRFERRAYYRHVTRGSHFKADHVKPCQRRDPKTGELTCPDGCRREWVPATVVGPEDKPFVPKSRVLSRPDNDDKEAA